MSKSVLPILILLALVLSACGGGATPVGDAAAGEALFNQEAIDSAPGCITCHSTQPGEVLVGPSQAGIATTAAQRVEGQSAEEYLRTSILEPNAYVVDGFAPDVMYQEYEQVLSDEQVDNLVAYLLTLE